MGKIYNKGGKGDDDRQYAKPGDDKIVSGKGFLISMPAFRRKGKSPSAIADAVDGAIVSEGKDVGGTQRSDNRRRDANPKPHNDSRNRNENHSQVHAQNPLQNKNDGANTSVTTPIKDNATASSPRPPRSGFDRRNRHNAVSTDGSATKENTKQTASEQGGNRVGQKPIGRNTHKPFGNAKAESAVGAENGNAQNAERRRNQPSQNQNRNQNQTQSGGKQQNEAPVSGARPQQNGRDRRPPTERKPVAFRPNTNTVAQVMGQQTAQASVQNQPQGHEAADTQTTAQPANTGRNQRNDRRRPNTKGGAASRPRQNSNQQNAATDGGENIKASTTDVTTVASNSQPEKSRQQNGRQTAQRPQRNSGRDGNPRPVGKTAPIREKNAGVGQISSDFVQNAAMPFRSRFDAKQKSESVAPEVEPVYVDKTRPLAEQIMEQSSKQYHYSSESPEEGKTEVVGIRFREAGKIYYFAPGDIKLSSGDCAIVETARGIEYGFVAIGNIFVDDAKIVPPLKTVLRAATEADTARYNENKNREGDAAVIFREKVAKLKLDMSLVYVEYTFDNTKLLFYFTSDGRVDFRELIKELASVFKTRIELRQIGVRDEAKLVGGLGICGRPICCNSFLGEFSQVSIKMAKDQNLFLNSSKISGTCGRFMCCLKYEDESYQKEYEQTPKVGSVVETPKGKGSVVESNAIKGEVKVLIEGKEDSLPVSFNRKDVKLIARPKDEVAPTEEGSKVEAAVEAESPKSDGQESKE